MKDSRKYLNRPHPGQEAKKYQIEELREWFKQLPEVHARALAVAKTSGKSLNQWAEEVLNKAAHI
jgi:hypothetical protein